MLPHSPSFVNSDIFSYEKGEEQRLGTQEEGNLGIALSAGNPLGNRRGSLYSEEVRPSP